MKTTTALIFFFIILISQNSFSQKEFLSLEEGVEGKIKFDNHSKAKADQTIIYSVFEVQLINVLSQSEISLITQDLTKNNIYHFDYISNSRIITFYKQNDNDISSIKDIMYSNNLEIIDYSTSYAIEK